jgi:hypothetical protein
MRQRGAELLYGCEHFWRVSLGRRFVPNPGDASIRTNQKCGAHDSQEGFAEKLLHAPRAVCLDGLEVRIAEQREIQFVFGRELGLSLHFISAAAQDDRA